MDPAITPAIWRGLLREAVHSAVVAIFGCLHLVATHAEPLQPRSDSEVVETLPTTGRERAEERGLRQRWAAAPGDAAVAVALARRYLNQAREQGDPRFAGRAMAVLQHWPQLDEAPPEVVLMSATLQQYLHDFEGAASRLEQLVKRAPRNSQAWLTLATVRRVQGRYAASDAACRGLASAGSAFYGRACEAENLALKGDVDTARRTLDALLSTPNLPPSPRAWLLTTLAELEDRAGRKGPSEAAYGAALAALPDEYARLSYADFLMANGRAGEVPALLRNEPRSDAVLMRLAMAGQLKPSSQSQSDIAELRARMLQAALRPQALSTHAREQAQFALHIDGDAGRALQFALSNVAMQREPVDLLLLAQAARAAKDTQSLEQARRIRTEMGLRDERLEALL